MHNRRRGTATLLIAVGLLLAACGNETTSSDASTVVGSTVTPPTTANPTTIAAAPTSAAPTTAVDPTVFHPSAIGDPLQLASFVLTVVESHSSNGAVNGRTSVTSYTKAPLSASVEIAYDTGDRSQEYIVAGRTYQNTNQGHWYLYEIESLAAPNILYDVAPSNALYRASTAVYLGEAEFAGLPAYHYTFDETNLDNFTSYTPERPSPEVEGDFYLAQQGNYLLYAHSRLVAAGEGYELIDEYTETMSSIYQLVEVRLPADMQPLQDALDLGLTLGVPMPADGKLDSMINYNDGGIGVYYYQYTSSWRNEAEFIAFYQGLAPTSGWTVTHIGQVKNLDVHCLDENCVIATNGDQQVIIYFDGSNLHVDLDREHRFSAQ